MATAIKILTPKETLIPTTKTTITRVTMMTEREGTPIKGTTTNMLVTTKARTGITMKRELNTERYFTRLC